jgi:hypothetical protein
VVARGPFDSPRRAGAAESDESDVSNESNESDVAAEPPDSWPLDDDERPLSAPLTSVSAKAVPSPPNMPTPTPSATARAPTRPIVQEARTVDEGSPDGVICRG